MTLEELLNKCIQRGWKPRGFEKVYNFGIENGYTIIDTKKTNYINFATKCVFRDDYQEEQETDYVSYTFRELVSKESGLWQFVCENGMVEHKYEVYYKCYIGEYGDADDYETLNKLEYRLIEAALKDESELEDFLLSNIKVEGN